MAKTLPLPGVSTAFMAKTLPLPCVPTASMAKTLPLPCVSRQRERDAVFNGTVLAAAADRAASPGGRVRVGGETERRGWMLHANIEELMRAVRIAVHAANMDCPPTLWR